MSNQTNRRSFFKIALTALATTTVASKVMAAACKVGAAPAGKKVVAVGASDKAGKRLQYTDNAATPVGKKKPKAANHACSNCKFYKADAKTPGYGKCRMLANRYVADCGWCKSYLVDKKKLKA